jgi:hypothetical protein
VFLFGSDRAVGNRRWKTRIRLRFFPVHRYYLDAMAQLSFALYAAFGTCGSVDLIAAKLGLPAQFVQERIEAARLTLLIVEPRITTTRNPRNIVHLARVED